MCRRKCKLLAGVFKVNRKMFREKLFNYSFLQLVKNTISDIVCFDTFIFMP